MHKNIGFVSVCFAFSVLALGSCARFSPKNQLNLGVWASENDLWDEAVFRWQKVLLSEPSSAAAHNNLAVAYENKGLWDEAEKEYSAALHLAPLSKYIKANYESFKENLRAVKKEKEKQDDPPIKDDDEKK